MISLQARGLFTELAARVARRVALGLPPQHVVFDRSQLLRVDRVRQDLLLHLRETRPAAPVSSHATA